MLRLLLLAAALLAPGMASAEPIAIAAAYVIGEGGVYWVVQNALTIALVAASVITSVNARRRNRRAQAAARSAYNSSLQDRSITALVATPPWRINYGRLTAGGDIIDVLTSDKVTVKEFGVAGSSTSTKPDAYKHLVIHLATHEIEAIHEVYIDGQAVGALDANGWATAEPFGKVEEVGRMAVFTTTTTLTVPVVNVLSCYETDVGEGWRHTDVTPTLSNGNLTVTVPAGKTVTFNYTVSQTTSTVRVQKFLGSDTQSLASTLQAIAPNTDSANHHLRGLACVVLTLDLEEPRFQGGANQITIDRSGKKLYDPRTGQTAYSNNPALVVRDFLTGVYGYECTADDIDDDYTIAAANACDVVIPLTTGNTTVNGPTYTCNGLVTTDSSVEATLEDLCESMAGAAVYGARWMITAGAWAPPVTLPGGGGLTDADLEGQVEIVQAFPGVDDVCNGARGTFIPAGQGQPTDADPYSNDVFVTADGRELWDDYTLPFTDDKARARNLFRIFVERTRIAQVIRFPGKLRTWPLRVGDRVPVTISEPPMDGLIFRVTDRQFGLTSPVMLTLERDAPEIWDQADAASANLAVNPSLPDPWTVGAITGLTATSSSTTMVKSNSTGSVVSRVVLTWDAVTDPLVNTSPGYIQVQWRRPGRDFESAQWPGDTTTAEILGVNHADKLVIRVRAVNGLQGTGPWSYVAHTVDGPTTIGTVELDDEAATTVIVDQANSTAVSVSVTAISRILPQAGTYEITLSGRANITSLSAADKLQVWFSTSGTSTNYGDTLPSYSATFNGQVIQISQSMTYIATGSAPWQIDVALDFTARTATATVSNLMMRTTLIKK